MASEYRNRISVIFLTCFFIALLNTSTVHAKDLFVSTSGNDTVSYDNNTVNTPWSSPSKAWQQALAGDTVYFRGGTYNINETIDTKSLGSANGTAEKPIIFTNYNNENVNFKSPLNVVFRIERNFNYINGINGEGGGIFWHVGYDNSAKNFKMTNCAGKTIKQGGSPNYGYIVFQSDRANYGTVENCLFTGPGAGLNVNTAGVFIFRSQGIKIKNCEFTAYPRAIFYKHTGINSPTGMEFSGNYFHGNRDGIVSVGNYILIENNLFVGDQIYIGEGGGLGDDGKNNGGDNNTIKHNTFYNTSINLTYVADGDGSGCKYNTIKDNVIMNKSLLHSYSSVPHYTTLDYNLYPSNYIVRENSIDYNLNEWRNHNKGDTHSVSGVPTFLGGNSPSNIRDYTLANGSVGKGAASDGKDMGIDVSAVGPKVIIGVIEQQGLNNEAQFITTNNILAPPPPKNIVIIK